MKILHVIGNRPQFIKLSPFLKATKHYDDIQNVIVHSGQHYDYDMSKIFFDELEIPKPEYNFYVGPGTHGEQTGKILIKLDLVLSKEGPDVVIVYGDTNTTLAGALAAYKLHFPLCHVEAGMREYTWRPEEINKKFADHCANFCFAPLERACENLRREAIPEDNIFFVGDITYDVFLQNRDRALKTAKIEIPESYILFTMHRAETVDTYNKIKKIIDAILEIPNEIIFPIHPRTRNRISQFGLYKKLENAKKINLISPVGYFEFIKLLINSKLVITDSSGVLKESFYAKKNCITIDNTTEYKEIFDMGCNILTGFGKQKILESINLMINKPFIEPKVNPFGNGSSSEKMVKIIIEKLKQD